MAEGSEGVIGIQLLIINYNMRQFKNRGKKFKKAKVLNLLNGETEHVVLLHS